MTDDRSLERAARSWLEEGPTRAPDRAVGAALSRIKSTQQERDLIPRRISQMPFFARAAAAAVVVIALASGTYLVFQGQNSSFGSSPSPAAPASAGPQASATDPIAAYRTARNEVCRTTTITFDSADLEGFYDPSLSPEDRAAVNAQHQSKQTAAVEAAAGDLAQIQPPAELAVEHWKDVAREEDLAALHRLVDELMSSDRVEQGAALDPTIVVVGDLRLAFEDRYNLFPCR
jgi:hypothetical protein